MDFAFQFLSNAFTAASQFFLQVVNGIAGASSIIIAAVFLFLLVRSLIKPIVGAGSSDHARKRKGSEEE